MRAIVVIHYVSTLLFNECFENDLLTTRDWEQFDMKEPVMKSEIKDDFIKSAVQDMYRNAFNFEFIFRKIFSIRNIKDIIFFFKAIKFIFGHIIDFGRKPKILNK